MLLVLFSSLQEALGGCKLMRLSYVWDGDEVCDITEPLTPIKSTLNFINVLSMEQQRFFTYANEDQPKVYCRFVGFNVPAGVQISNMVINFNAVVSTSGCDSVEIAPIGDVFGSLTNVTVVGQITAKNMSAVIGNTFSYFIGSFGSADAITDCKYSFKYNVEDDAGNSIVLSTTYSNFNMSALNSSQLIQVNLADVPSTTKDWTLMGQPVQIKVNTQLSDVDFQRYYVAAYHLFLERAHYLKSGVCDFTGAATSPEQVICNLGNRTWLIKATNDARVYTETMCLSGAFNPTTGACVLKENVQDGFFYVNGKLVTSCPTGYNADGKECVVFCGLGKAVSATDAVCVACAQMALSEGRGCVDTCSGFAVGSLCYPKECPIGYTKSASTCVQASTCNDYSSTYLTPPRCLLECPLSRKVSAQQCDAQCPANELMLSSRIECTTVTSYSSGVSQPLTAGRQFAPQCQGGYYNQSGACQTQCNDGWQADLETRICMQCAKSWDRATRTCVDACQTADGLNGTYCEQVGEVVNCPYYYKNGGKFYCMLLCSGSYPYLSSDASHILCVSVCLDREEIKSNVCTPCGTDQLWDRLTKKCGVASCSYWNSTNKICEQFGNATHCPSVQTIGGKQECMKTCSLYSDTNKSLCLGGCTEQEPFKEGTYCKTYCKSSSYYTMDAPSSVQTYTCTNTCATVYGRNDGITTLGTAQYCAASCSLMVPISQQYLYVKQCVQTCPPRYSFVDATNVCVEKCTKFVDKTGVFCLDACPAGEKPGYVDQWKAIYCTECAMFTVPSYNLAQNVTSMSCATQCLAPSFMYDTLCIPDTCIAFGQRVAAAAATHVSNALQFTQGTLCQAQCNDNYGNEPADKVCYKCNPRYFFSTSTRQCVKQCAAIRPATGAEGLIRFCETAGSAICPFTASSYCVSACTEFQYLTQCVTACPAGKYRVDSSNKICDVSGSLILDDEEVLCQTMKAGYIFEPSTTCNLSGDYKAGDQNVTAMTGFRGFRYVNFNNAADVYCRYSVFNSTSATIQNKLLVVNGSINAQGCTALEVSVFDKADGSWNNVKIMGDVSITFAPKVLNLYRVGRNLTSLTAAASSSALKYYVSFTGTVSYAMYNDSKVCDVGTSASFPNSYVPIANSSYWFVLQDRKYWVPVLEAMDSAQFIKYYQAVFQIQTEAARSYLNAPQQRFYTTRDSVRYNQLISQKLLGVTSLYSPTGLVAGELRCAMYYDPAQRICATSCDHELYGICVSSCPSGFFTNGIHCVQSCPYGTIADWTAMTCSQAGDPAIGVLSILKTPVRQCLPGMTVSSGACVNAVSCADGLLLVKGDVTYCASKCPIGMFVQDATCVSTCLERNNETHCITGDCWEGHVIDREYCASACRPTHLNRNGKCGGITPLCGDNQTTAVEYRVCLNCTGVTPFFSRDTKLCLATCAYLNSTDHSNICETPNTEYCEVLRGFKETQPLCAHQCDGLTPYVYEAWQTNPLLAWCVLNCTVVASSDLVLKGSLFLKESGSNRCVEMCPDKFYRYVSWKLLKQCMTSCEAPYRYYEIITYKTPLVTYNFTHCMSDCDWSDRSLHFENTRIDSNDYECKPKCDQANWGKACISQPCTAYVYLYNLTYYTTPARLSNETKFAQTPICTDTCPDFAPILVNNKLCVYNCEEPNVFIDNRQCSTTCASGVFDYQWNGAMVCTNEKCYLYEKVRGVKHCRTSCDYYDWHWNGNPFQDGVECISKCPDERSLIEPNNVCTDLCSSRIYNETSKYCIDSIDFCRFVEPENWNTSKAQYRCTNACSTGKLIYTNVTAEYCLDACPSDMPYIFGNACTDVCLAYYVDGTKLICVNTCETFPRFVREDGILKCLPDCPTDKKLVYNGKECLAVCPSFQYANLADMTCVDTCATGLSYQDPTYQQSCWAQASCGGSFPYKDNNVCVTACPGLRPFYYNNVCYTTCSAVTTNTSRLYWIANQYLCMQTCPDTNKWADGNNCKAACAANSYWTYNQTNAQQWICQATCVLDAVNQRYMYKNTTQTNTNQCVDACPSNTSYNFYNGSIYICIVNCSDTTAGSTINGLKSYYQTNKTCTSLTTGSCTMTRSDGASQFYCLYGCIKETEYYLGRLCVTSCQSPNPFVYTNTTGYRYCEPSNFYNKATNPLTGDKNFVTSCPTYYIEVMENLQQLFECRTSCDNAYHGLQCKDYCPPELPYRLENKTCVLVCPTFYQRIDALRPTCNATCETYPVVMKPANPYDGKKEGECLQACPTGYDWLYGQVCMQDCIAPNQIYGLLQQCKPWVEWYNLLDNGSRVEVASCPKYHLEGEDKMKRCIDRCNKFVYNGYCIESCPDTTIPLDNRCLEKSMQPSKCADDELLQNGMCVKICQGTYDPIGKICVEQCLDGCCPSNQIFKNGTCVAFENQNHIITPSGEKIFIETCVGFQLPSGLCVTSACAKDEVWIDSACFPIVKCEFEVWNGVCVNTCLDTEFFDRYSELCVSICNYRNGTVCEDPEDKDNCLYHEPIAGLTNTFKCVSTCDNGYTFGKVCYSICPDDMITIGNHCDYQCRFFHNGYCVLECDLTKQIQIDFVCMDKIRPTCPTGQYPNQLNLCEEYYEYNDDEEGQILQTLPDGQDIIVNCQDGIVDNKHCVMRCPAGTVWIERNCYPEKYCPNPKEVDYRLICIDGPVTSDPYDPIIAGQCI